MGKSSLKIVFMVALLLAISGMQMSYASTDRGYVVTKKSTSKNSGDDMSDRVIPSPCHKDSDCQPFCRAGYGSCIEGLFISSVLAHKGSLMGYQLCGPSRPCQIYCRIGIVLKLSPLVLVFH
ncbi:hypothetical protein Lser_V15G37012 [Lactuca serriola]